jgi:gluconate 5-dehydrogenase
MNDAAYTKFDLSGKTAFVTGGGTGLGYSISRALAQSGARVLIAARREDVLRDAAQRLAMETGCSPVSYVGMDLAVRESVYVAAQQAIEKLCGIDIFVANAAQEKMEVVHKITDSAVDRLHQVNVASNISLVKTFLPHMRERKWGRVIMISSVGSIRAAGRVGMAVYSSNKAALNSFARVAAADVGHDGITFNSLILGMYKTEIMEESLKEMDPRTRESTLRKFSENTALGRWGECSDIEGAIQLLASDAGSYITGADIHVDGGLSIMMSPMRRQEN